ncbi:Nicastrin [Acorus gramineus]|uniref:Nicastrin n=1 Tax=Acorus gramineus TaxID=55184 RepID=A0AAV9AIV0_ACOGR|nr:Nicastrin [Acorus gramineus]
MFAKLKLVILSFCLVSQIRITSSASNGRANTLESVPDLEKAMYLSVDGYPCVRLLNLSGGIGCANPGHAKVIAPIIRFKNADEKLAHLSSAMLELSVDSKDGSVGKIDTLTYFWASNDLNFSSRVAGVLVESVAGYQYKPSGFSPVKKFPQAEFSPYKDSNYEWNPAGSGIMLNRYDFPVFLVSENSTSLLREMAEKNEKQNEAYPLDVAEFDLVMQTTRVGTHNSESCLKGQSCLPLGGYSVWSSLPPINISSMKAPKPILLAVTSMDSASFFRDKSLGADSSVSGMISLLAAVDALSRMDGLNELKKQLVFLVVTGEAWGYLGSRRFLLELDEGSDTTNGLNSTLIEQVLEIGSVGKGLGKGVSTFYAHSQGNSCKNSGSLQESSATTEIMRAFELACDSLGTESIKFKKSNTLNPGVPPSSLMTFMRKNSSTSGIVLEEFDSAFTNNFYHSNLDDICMECALVKKFISPASTCPNHYVGVFLGAPSNSQYPDYADDTSRFVWNFLADRTSTSQNNTSSVCSGECSNAGEVCVGAETESKGICVTSTTRFVPAYSTRLKYEDEIWKVMPAKASDPMGAVDPVWTESFWNTIGLRVYTVQSSDYDHFVLLGGIIVTVASYVAVVVTRAFFKKALKRD